MTTISKKISCEHVLLKIPGRPSLGISEVVNFICLRVDCSNTHGPIGKAFTGSLGRIV
jgi:hypothetical protein